MTDLHPGRMTILAQVMRRRLALGSRPLFLLSLMVLLCVFQPQLILVLVLTMAVVAVGRSIWRGSSQQRRIEAAAVDWFARFHEGPLETFDWTTFEGWIQADPRHRAAYDRVEALFYALDEAEHADDPAVADEEDLSGAVDTGAEVIDLQQRRAMMQGATAGLRQVG